MISKKPIRMGRLTNQLIDRKNRKVEVYRQGRDVEILDNSTSLSGEDVLPGFVLDLTEVW
jgi:Uma2 family endonuclease